MGSRGGMRNLAGQWGEAGDCWSVEQRRKPKRQRPADCQPASPYSAGTASASPSTLLPRIPAERGHPASREASRRRARESGGCAHG